MSEGFVFGGAGLSSIDGKARVTLPAELRDTVVQSSGGTTLCLARHPSLPCLIAFGEHERAQLRTDLEIRWRAAVERGVEFDREAEGRKLAPSLASVAFETSGRFVCPPMLLHFGKLEQPGRAFFFGNIYRIEIWNPEILMTQQGDAFDAAKDALDYHLAMAGRKAR